MKLLEPLTINGMRLPNRIMVPAMVTRLSGEDGYVNQAVIDRYVRYAEGEVGLIVVEAMAVHGAKSGPLLRISHDAFVAGHRELVRRVHDTSASRIVPQIIHFMKVARSGWRQTIDSLSREDIDLIVEQFGAAAARAREAGYDGVKLGWSRPAQGQVAGYDINRAEDSGAVRCLEAVKGPRFVDRSVLGGLRYTYYVRAYGASARASPPSNSVAVEPEVPAFGDAAESKDPEALHG